MGEPKLSEWRVIQHERGVYIIRDILHASGKFSGQCQYAVRDDQEMTWRPCVEGVLFADIEPFVRLS